MATSDYAYDGMGRLTGLTHTYGTTDIEYTWTYDAAGRIVKMECEDGLTDFTLDNTDQLIEADHDYQADEDYQYDNNGNREEANGQTYATGDQNRLLSDGTYTYQYDDEGNRTARYVAGSPNTDVTEYEWDHRNRLVKVTHRAVEGGPASSVVEYTYDYLGRRIRKTVDSDADGTPEEFRYNVHQGDEIYLEVTDPDGLGNQTQSPTVAHRYLYGPAVDQVLAVEDDQGEVLWGLGDHQGTVRDVVDSSGNLAEHRQYDSFGNLTDPAAPAVDFLFAFTGRPLDEDTGLYDYRARWYDPGVGRFVTEDPLGLDAGDPNLYRYCNNSPVVNVDPSGLCYAGSGVSMSEDTMDAWQLQLTNLSMMGHKAERRVSQARRARDDAWWWQRGAAQRRLSRAQTARAEVTGRFREFRDELLSLPAAQAEAVLRGTQFFEAVGQDADWQQVLQSPNAFREALLKVGRMPRRRTPVGGWASPTRAAAGSLARGEGLAAGGKAVVNGLARSGASIVSLGYWEVQGPLAVTDYDRFLGYDTAVMFSEGSGYIIGGVLTGSGAGFLAKGGQLARYGSYGLRGLDAASNVVEVGRGGVSMYNEGITLQNSLQVLGGSGGLAGDFRDVLGGLRRAPGGTIVREGSSAFPAPYLARTPDLPETARLGDVLEKGWIPGEQGITLTDRTVRFADVYRLTEKTGIEFGLTREIINGRRVRRLYSGGADAVTMPKGPSTRVIGHTHVTRSRVPSTRDISNINKAFLDALETNPVARVAHRRVIWGSGATHSTIYYPSVVH